VKYILQIFMVVIVLSSWAMVHAADDVIIRTGGMPEKPLVGQKVVVTIDVLARDGWATLEKFPPMEVPGAYLHRYETQGTRLNETIGGGSYSGQRYEVLLFAYKEGELTIPSFPAEVSVKTWGADAATKKETLSTEPVVLSVSPPEGGAINEYLPVSAKMEAKQRWSSQEEEYNMGDAIEREVTRRGEDISAMVFAPYELPAMEGMSCYMGQPEVEDSFNRGILIGIRKERLSCILEKPGEFRFPDITFAYWNEEKREQERMVLPGFSFSVKGIPGENETGVALKVSEKKVWSRVSLLVVVCILCLILFICRHRLILVFQQRWDKRHNSEEYLFKKIGMVAENGCRQRMFAAIMRWLDSLPDIQQPGRLDTFAALAGDKVLATFLNDLTSKDDWTSGECHTLFTHLRRARKCYHRKKSITAAHHNNLPAVGLGGFS